MPDRKRFLRQLGKGFLFVGMPGIASAENISIIDAGDFKDEGAPNDEKYWKRIARKYYKVTPDYINLENGYFGVQSKPVLEAFLKNSARVNSELARFARKVYPELSASVKKTLAAFLQVSDEEIIITRNATEALNIAIQGYPFQPGDEVLINQLDYFSMIETFRLLEKRGKIKVNAFEMPLLPQNDDEIVDQYRKYITDKTKVILLTHVSNINGLIVPVKKITALAKAAGIDTITDSAHALGHISFSLPELGSDFVGMNLHKWIGNPIGAGVLYIKKERIPEMNVFFGDFTAAENNISKLAHFGTTPFAVSMTIPDSIAFHQLMGIQKITNRVHYLKSIWVNEFRQHPAVELVTPPSQELSCAIASFRIKNKNNTEVANYLMQQHGIMTVARTLGKEGCIRVTPSVYNSVEDLKKLVMGIKSLS